MPRVPDIGEVIDLDPARHAVVAPESNADVNCPHCKRWLKGDATPGCCATVATLEGAAHFSMQRIILHNHKRCDHKAKVRVGHLVFCGIHHRLVREGFVDETGHVVDHSSIAAAHNHPKKFPGGFYHWHNELPDNAQLAEKETP